MKNLNSLKLSSLLIGLIMTDVAHAAPDQKWKGPVILRTEAPLKIGALVEAVKTDDGVCFYKGKVNIQKGMSRKTALKWIVNFTTLVCKNETDTVETTIKGEAILTEALSTNDSLDVTITP